MIYFEYDALDRRTGIEYVGVSEQSFGYDAMGNLKAMEDGSGVSYFAYDALNRLERRSAPQDVRTVAVDYQYDAIEIKGHHWPSSSMGGMVVITPPLFLIERRSQDVTSYCSVEELIAYLELIDVENNEYNVFDAEGRRMRLEILDGQIVLDPIEQEPRHVQELETALRKFLAMSGNQKRFDLTCNLQQLVLLFQKYKPDRFGFSGLLNRIRILLGKSDR